MQTHRLLTVTALAVLSMQSFGAKTNSGYGDLPLAFEPNLGQMDSRVRFLARGGGMTAFFTDTEAVMVLSRTAAGGQSVVRMKLEGSAPARRTVGLEKLPGISNYFIGNDPRNWRTDVPHFGRIQSNQVYPGIDMVWYGNQSRLEYDFLVAAGSDPGQIQVAYEGVESLAVEAGGDLVLHTALGEVRQQKPRVYQDVNGKQVEVAARYSVTARNRVTFALAGYDRSRQLRIDPVVLVYSTFLGGSGYDYGAGIAVDAAGSAYILGYTASTDFPTRSPYQANLAGSGSAFVTKLTPAGNALVYSTYLGGSSSQDYPTGIAVDGAGSAYITGTTSSTNFPTQSSYQASLKGSSNAFVTKLAPAGNALVYSTYLGGSGGDKGNAIALDSAGSAYIVGNTDSADFPTRSPFQAVPQGFDVFVTKLTPAGNALVYSTYLGGSGSDNGYGIAVDSAGAAYVTGSTRSSDFPTQSPFQATLHGLYNAFVTKLAPAGNALVYSTYLGGINADTGQAVAVDAAGSAFVTGTTSSITFPTQSPFQATLPGSTAAFLTKLTAAGNALIYSTFLGGTNSDAGLAIAVDGSGSAYVSGQALSTDFLVQSPYQATRQGTSANAFVTKFTRAGNALVYSTYLPGTWASGIALDAQGSAYVTGVGQNAPLWPSQGTDLGIMDAFVTKLANTDPSLRITKSHVGNFAPGQIGASYSVTVANATGANPTSGTVTVSEVVPTGLALVSMAGTGWTCPAGGTTCTRSDALSGGLSYPAITVTVNVAANAAPQVSNHVNLSGGGSAVDSTADLAFVTNCTAIPANSLAIGGTAGMLTVTFSGGACDWTATSNAPWLSPSASSGNGAGVSVAVAGNTTGAPRTGTLLISGQTVGVTQAANNPGQFPSLISLNPFQGTGLNATLTFVYADANGWAAISSAEFIVNPRWEPSGRAGGCYVKYAPTTGLFTLIADNGSSVAGTTAPGSSTNISNSQCTLNAAASYVNGSGNNLTVIAALTFSPGFGGQRHIWMQAVDNNNVSTNWMVYGVWFPTQTTFAAGPWYRIYDPNSKSYLYSADQNEYNVLGAEGFLQQGVSGLTMSGPGTVAGVSNLAFYRVFVTGTNSHFWTSDRNEYLTLISSQTNYVGEGVATFIMPYFNAQGQISPQVTNSIPFYRAAFQGANLHFWTSDPNEYFGMNGKHLPPGYFGEGISSYLFPAGGAQLSTAPFSPAVETAAAADDGSPAILSVANGASSVSNGAVAPGQLLTVYGRHLSGRTLLNGLPPQVTAAQENFIRIVVPNGLRAGSQVDIEVEHGGRRTTPVTLSVSQADPAIFVNTPYGRGNGEARNEDGSANDSQHPAARGSVVTLYTTGIAAAGTLPVEAHLGGLPAEVLSTKVSAARAGVVEVQIRVPQMVEPGPFQPVVLQVGNLFSQPGVGLAIR